MSVHEYFLRHSMLRTMKYVWGINFFLLFSRATLMDSKTVDQLVIWRAGRQQVFSRPLDIIHPTTRLWQPMGKLSQLIYQKLLLQYLKQASKQFAFYKTLDYCPQKASIIEKLPFITSWVLLQFFKSKAAVAGAS